MDADILYLIIYIFVALGFSFLCSILEAAFLSTSLSHIEVLVKQGKRYGLLMRKHKQNVEDGISAILTLNTIAHTVGAAGAGAQAAIVFGNKWIGAISAVLTFLILVFSEIIPKTLGAHYWKHLTAFTAYTINILVWLLYPIVWSTRGLSKLLSPREELAPTISRAELEVLAKIGAGEGVLKPEEHRIFENLLRLYGVTVTDIMTPRTVVFMLQQDKSIEEVVDNNKLLSYSRIPIFETGPDEVSGFVLRHELLAAKVENKSKLKLSEFLRPINAVPYSISVARLLKEFIKRQEHIFLVVDEYGGMAGIVSFEDALESLLGAEIIDETDIVTDMRELAKKRRAKKFKNTIT